MTTRRETESNWTEERIGHLLCLRKMQRGHVGIPRKYETSHENRDKFLAETINENRNRRNWSQRKARYYCILNFENLLHFSVRICFIYVLYTYQYVLLLGNPGLNLLVHISCIYIFKHRNKIKHKLKLILILLLVGLNFLTAWVP